MSCSLAPLPPVAPWRAISTLMVTSRTVSYTNLIWDAISDLAYLESGEGEEVSRYRLEPQSDYQRMLRQGSREICNHLSLIHI